MGILSTNPGSELAAPTGDSSLTFSNQRPSQIEEGNAATPLLDDVSALRNSLDTPATLSGISSVGRELLSRAVQDHDLLAQQITNPNTPQGFNNEGIPASPVLQPVTGGIGSNSLGPATAGSNPAGGIEPSDHSAPMFEQERVLGIMRQQPLNLLKGGGAKKAKSGENLRVFVDPEIDEEDVVISLSEEEVTLSVEGTDDYVTFPVPEYSTATVSFNDGTSLAFSGVPRSGSKHQHDTSVSVSLKPNNTRFHVDRFV